MNVLLSASINIYTVNYFISYNFVIVQNPNKLSDSSSGYLELVTAQATPSIQETTHTSTVSTDRGQKLHNINQSPAVTTSQNVFYLRDSAQTNQSVYPYDAISNDHIEFIQEPKVCM